MKLTVKLANEMIRRVNETVDVPINLMDETGTILASSDPARIGEFHSGAMVALKRQSTVIIKDELIDQYPNTKPGVNIPVMFQDEIIGVVGVTGDPDHVFQLANMTRMTIEMIIEQTAVERQNFVRERRLRDWIQKLVHPLGFDESQLVQEAGYLDEVDLNQYYQIALFTSHHTAFNIDLITHTLNQYVPHYAFITLLNQYEIVVAFKKELTDGQSLIIEENLPENGLYIGTFDIGVSGLRKSYMFAKEAWFMSDFSNKQNDVVNIRDLKLEVAIRSISNEAMGLLSDEQDYLNNLSDEYVQSFYVYFNCNFHANETAQQLHIHRNTLNYRLDMIKQKTNLNPKNVKEALMLYILLTRQRFSHLHKIID
ncbi:CdaR family transcriptional regulator [Alkalibacillus haloalkaliphilus]|uniref:CdaR family transcriptional regulator n=1 Tax=Alkalibacillus haloalkaliphilus TaxID=94136 RepID=UPI0029360884|nr:sugar diacid recognition domain-containing protein [Alkalibacillus haloalkaliphilus]MDV2582754.1 sugar diacid recognition domain-containing protein [Alkalibacillus haloalkaliphilus]